MSHLSKNIFYQNHVCKYHLWYCIFWIFIILGIAIGLQENSGQLISIFIAVITHKAVMAFSLGLNIAQSELSLRSFIISNIMFSLASPVGVGIGIAMAGLPSVSLMT